MKLAAFVLSLVFAGLVSGQTSIQVQSPSGPVRLSANSISGGAADKERAMLDHLRTAVLRQQLTHMQVIYTMDHPKIRQLQSEISASEAAAMADDISAQSKTDNGVIQLKGNVEIKTDTMTLAADEAAYHPSTGEIEPRGAVRVKLNSK